MASSKAQVVADLLELKTQVRNAYTQSGKTTLHELIDAMIERASRLPDASEAQEPTEAMCEAAFHAVKRGRHWRLCIVEIYRAMERSRVAEAQPAGKLSE